MFAKLFRGCKDESSPKSTTLKLKQALEKLEAKEIILLKRISTEDERAKEFTYSKNKEALGQCLKRKNFYEVQMEQVERFRLRIRDQELKLSKRSADASGEVQKLSSKSSSSLSNWHL